MILQFQRLLLFTISVNTLLEFSSRRQRNTSFGWLGFMAYQPF